MGVSRGPSQTITLVFLQRYISTLLIRGWIQISLQPTWLLLLNSKKKCTVLRGHVSSVHNPFFIPWYWLVHSYSPYWMITIWVAANPHDEVLRYVPFFCSCSSMRNHRCWRESDLPEIFPWRHDRFLRIMDMLQMGLHQCHLQVLMEAARVCPLEGGDVIQAVGITPWKWCTSNTCLSRKSNPI